VPAVSDLITVAKVHDVQSGEARVFYVRGREIAVFNLDGTFYAIRNLCPHQGGPLVAGTVEGEVVTCPWHRWQFHLPTGALLANPSISVEAYPVVIENGEIRVRFKDEPSSLW
jgi:NAD(P)H-dependent nitrite reductase small subunit